MTIGPIRPLRATEEYCFAMLLRNILALTLPLEEKNLGQLWTTVKLSK